MRTITNERLEQILTAHRNADRHLVAAVSELRQMRDELAVICGESIRYRSPFFDHSLFEALSDEHLKQYQHNLDISCWKDLLSETQCLDKMTKDSKDKLLNSITRGEFGAFEMEIIHTKLTMLQDRQTELLQEILIQAFRFLCPDPYKKLPINKKSVVHSGSYNSLDFSCSNSDKWDVIEKAFLLLDNRELPENFALSLPAQMQNALRDGLDSFEWDYFKAKYYCNSKTVHLTFKRMDLIEKINQAGINA